MLKYLFPLLLIASPLQAQDVTPPNSGVVMVSLKCPQMPPARFTNVEVAVAFVQWSYGIIDDEQLFFTVAKTPGLSVEAARQWVNACKGTPA